MFLSLFAFDYFLAAADEMKKRKGDRNYDDDQGPVLNREVFLKALSNMCGSESASRRNYKPSKKSMPDCLRDIISIEEFLEFDRLVREKPIPYIFFHCPLADAKDCFSSFRCSFISQNVCSEEFMDLWANSDHKNSGEASKRSMSGQQRWIDAQKNFGLRKFKYLIHLLLEPSFQDTMNFLVKDVPRYLVLNNNNNLCSLEATKYSHNFTTNIHVNPFSIVTKIQRLFNSLSDNVNIWLTNLNGGDTSKFRRVNYAFSSSAFSLNVEGGCMPAGKTIALCLRNFNEFLRSFAQLRIIGDSAQSITDVSTV